MTQQAADADNVDGEMSREGSTERADRHSGVLAEYGHLYKDWQRRPP